MFNGKGNPIDKWISQVASELRGAGELDLQAIYSLPSLRHSDVVDLHNYIPHHFRNSYGEGDEEEDAKESELTGKIPGFKYTVPLFGHKVHLPLRAPVALPPALPLIVRRCFANWRRYSLVKKSKKDKLVDALLHWRQNTLHNCMNKWKKYHILGKVLLLRNSFYVWKIHTNKKHRNKTIIETATKTRAGRRKRMALIAWQRYTLETQRERQRVFFIESRHSILTLAYWFERWLRSLQRSRVSRVFEHEERIRLSGLVLKEWRAAVSFNKMKRVQTAKVVSFCSYNLLNRTFRGWTNFIKESNQKKVVARRALAVWHTTFCFRKWRKFVETNLLMRALRTIVSRHVVVHHKRACFLAWRDALYDKRLRVAAVNKFILKRCFRRWTKFVKLMPQVNGQRQKAIQFFMHKKFNKWKLWAKAKRITKRGSYYFSLRFFRRWNRNMHEKRRLGELERMGRAFYYHRTAPFTLHKYIHNWVKYVSYKHYRRKLVHKATVFYFQFVLPKRLHKRLIRWKMYADKRKVSQIIDSTKMVQWRRIKLSLLFHRFVRAYAARQTVKRHELLLFTRLHGHLKRKNLARATKYFRLWKTNTLGQLQAKYSIATTHANKVMLGKCFLAWTKFNKQRIMDQVASVVFCTNRKRRVMYIWKQCMNEQFIKWRIAELYNKRSLLQAAFSGLKRYNQMAKEAMELRVYPLVQRKAQRMITKAFHNWALYTRRVSVKNDFNLQALKFRTYHCLSVCFRKWRAFVAAQKNTKIKGKPKLISTHNSKNNKRVFF